MRSVIYLTLSALAALAAAANGTSPNPFDIPSTGLQFTAGKATTITWNPTTSGTVTIELGWGEPIVPGTKQVIASSIANSGSFTWDVPSDIQNRGDYALEIIDDADPSENNWTERFGVIGATAIPTSATASSTSASASSTSTGTKTTLTSSSSTTSTSSATSSTTSTTKTSTSTASSTTAAPSETVKDTNGGMINRVSGGMMAIVLGAIAFM